MQNRLHDGLGCESKNQPKKCPLLQHLLLVYLCCPFFNRYRAFLEKNLYYKYLPLFENQSTSENFCLHFSDTIQSQPVSL